MAGTDSQSGGFQDSRGERFLDQSAYTQMKEPVESSLKNIVENNPHLVNDPALLNGFANQNGLSSSQVSNAVQYLTMFGGVKQHSIDAGQGDPLASHAPGFWSSLSHSVSGMWDHAANATKRVANFWTNPDEMIGAAESTVKGLGAGVKGIADFAGSIEKRGVLSVEELATLGFYGPKGWNTNFAGLDDVFNTTKNLVETTGNMVNPFSSGNIFMLMSHNMAFYNSLAKRYGWGYAIGYATPALAAGFATDGAFTGADVAATAAEDAATVARAGEAFRAGRSLSEADRAVVQKAASRQIARIKQDAGQEVAQATRAGRVAQLSRTMRATAKTLEYATKPLGGAIRVAKALGKPMSDLKLNTMYGITQATAQANPQLAAIWNDPNVRNGVAIDANGRPMGTNGQMLASYFGMDKGNMFFSPVSGLTDFYTKWLGTDPLGAVGKAVGASRTFGGFTGKLGHWFGGLGVRGADSIDLAAKQYRRVRNAFEFMAKNDAATIADTFRNTYIDDAKKGIKAGSIIDQLGKAKSVEEVMQIHRDIAESTAFTKSMVPTLSMYEISKAALKGRLGERFGTVGKMFSVDGKYLEQISKDKELMKETGGIPIKPNTELLYVDNNVLTRSMHAFARWMATRLTRSSMYIDELTNKVENSVIRPGSVNAIPAIMDFLRASLLPENVVKGVGDLLLQAKDPQEYINVYRHAVYHAVMRRATAGLDRAEMATFIGTSSDHIWNEVVKMTGVDGGGAVGLYAAGVNGADLSIVADAETGIERYAGIGANHLGELRFPRTAELRGLADVVRGYAIDIAKTEPADFARTRQMTIEQLQSVVDFHNPKTLGLENQLDRIGAVNKISLSVHGEEAVAGYTKASEKIKTIIKETNANPEIIDAQRFTTTYDALRVERASIQRQVNALSEVIRLSKASVGPDTYNTIVNDIMEQYPNVNATNAHTILAGLKGELSAHDDALRQMEIRMTAPSVSMERVRTQAQAYIEAVKGKAKADRLLKTNYLDQVEKWHAQKNPYIPRFQRGVDMLNRGLSKTFVPLALFSGGWALRVSASEAMLNSLRFGGWASFDAKITQAIAKHEVYGAGLISVGKKSERNLIKDVVAGALLGVERNLIKGFDQAKRDRMLEDFVGSIMRHNGHLPGGVHEVNDTVFNDNTVKTALLNTSVGINDKGESVLSQTSRNKSFESKNIGGVGYAKSLRMNTASIARDELLQPTAGRLADMMFARGEQKTGELLGSHMTWRDITNAGEGKFVNDQTGRWQETIGAGAKSFRKREDVLALREELRKGALEDIRKMDPGDRARFARDTGRSKQSIEFSGNNAHEDWANAIVEHVMASVSGLDKEGNTIFHAPLVDQAATGNMKGELEFAQDVKRFKKGAEPKHIPTGNSGAHDALGAASASDFLRNLSQKGHDKMLGPIVNRLVREPIFLLEQHKAMEGLRGLVDSNIIDEATAQVISDQRAMTNMIKYVHNPKDKTLFEVNMRVAAPFYFAQNQAWRRAFRVLHEDPGAFEKYLKLSLGVTNYISTSSAGGAFPSIAIPGTTFMGVTGSGGGSIPAMGGDASPFAALGFGLAADPGSVSSVFPTGAEGGLAGILGLARPAWGPLVTIPIKLAEKLYGTDTHPLATKVLSAFLGPISQSSSLQSDFFPSTVGRNALDAVTSIASSLGATDLMSTAQISTQNQVMNNAIDALYKQQYDKVYNSTDFSGINPQTGNVWTKDQIINYCRGNADLAITNLFNNHEYYQDFLSRAKAAAIVMMVVKGAIAFASPVAVSINSQFSKTAEFAKIQSSINPDTGNKYTFQEAATKFAELYPYNVMDLTAHSRSTYASYPETISAVKMLTEHPGITRQYPNASAYMIDRNTAYSPQAYQLEIELGLRARQAPQDYLNSLLISAGNDYYYNYLAPQIQYGGDGTKAGDNISGGQYAALKAAADAYGNSTNPTWYANHTGGQKHDIQIKSVKEMTDMINDPSVPESILPKAERAKFKDILGQYDKVVTEVTALKAAGDKSDATAVEQAWYSYIQDNATNNTYWAKQAYFMTSVLAGLPTKG